MYCTDRLVYACDGRSNKVAGGLLLQPGGLRRPSRGHLCRALIGLRWWQPSSSAGGTAGLSAARLVQLSTVTVRIIGQDPALWRHTERNLVTNDLYGSPPFSA